MVIVLAILFFIFFFNLSFLSVIILLGRKHFYLFLVWIPLLLTTLVLGSKVLVDSTTGTVLAEESLIMYHTLIYVTIFSAFYSFVYGVHYFFVKAKEFIGAKR